MKKLALVIEPISNGYLLTVERTSPKQEPPCKMSFKTIGKLWEYVYEHVADTGRETEEFPTQ